MKHVFRILVLAVILVAGLTVSAQTVQVIVTQKTPTLPTTTTNYLDDPFRYFNVQLNVTGAGSEGLEVFYDLDFSVSTNSSFYFHTKPGSIPAEPIHLDNGPNFMKRDEMLKQLRNKRLETSLFTNPVNAQKMPEGTYQLCLDVYLWSDRNNPARVPISYGTCPTFDLCYSGSAPELVSPLAGAQMALNGAMVVTPVRKVNFFWSPVISNCSNNTRFKYQLKVVQVLDGQNYNDAIKYNPTIFSTEVRNNTHVVFDTLRDIKVPMERGALYVAQVRAERINASKATDAFIIANDGNSQPMPFYWGFPKGPLDAISMNPTDRSSRGYGYYMENEDVGEEDIDAVNGLTQWIGGVEGTSDLETVIDEMKEQYLVEFIQDAATVASLTAAYPSERQYVPTPSRRYVESDGYYTVQMTDDLEVSFMPARHESLKNVSYTIELYDYVNGGIDSITSYEPLLSEKIEEVPASYNKMNSHELISRTLTGWGTELQAGNLYYLQLSSFFTVGYHEYSIADTSFYVNGLLAEHIYDTVARNFVEDELMYSNGVFFQWGDDPEVPDFTTPQWKAPVDRTSDDIYDPLSYVIPVSVPEVQNAKTFPVSWTPVKDVTPGDEVQYEVNVYELKPGQTLEEAVSSNEILVSRTVTNVNEIAEDDTKFFKVFSPHKTYVMMLTTNVYGDSDTFYHFENGNDALPIVFKIVK